MKKTVVMILGLLLASTTLAAGKDGLWEVTSKMEMEGMSEMPKGFSIPGMPGGAIKQTICLADGKKYERDDQKGCKVLEQRQSGRKSFTKLKCKEGTMTIEHENISKDHWRSKLVMTGEDAMTAYTEGKRIGNCDAGKEGNMSRETQKLLDDAAVDTKRSAAQMAKDCQETVAKWPSQNPFASYDWMAEARKKLIADTKGADMRMVNSTHPDVPQCATAKVDYCTKIKSTRGSREAYHAAASRNKAGLNESFPYCGVDGAAILSGHCKAALAASSIEFIVEYCPAERKVLSDKYCVGRDYTSLDPKLQPVCLTRAGNKSGRGYTAAHGSGKIDAVEEGVKALKGLFGF